MAVYKGKRSKKDLIASLPGDALIPTARFWANNSLTYQTEDGSTGYTLHDTEIMRVAPDGAITLNTGGWQTSTTKQRLNELLSFAWPSQFYIYQEGGIWYLRVGSWDEGRSWVYKDGMTLTPYTISSAAGMEKKWKVKGAGINPAAAKAQRKAIKKYAKDYIEALFAGEVEAPGPGDCWFCCLVNEDGEPWGENANDTAHLDSHIEDKYYVGSLLYRAAQVGNVSQVAWWTLQDLWGGGGEYVAESCFNDIAKEQLRKALESYLFEQYGLPR